MKNVFSYQRFAIILLLLTISFFACQTSQQRNNTESKRKDASHRMERWKDGHYANYISRFRDGSWESYNFFLHGKLEDGSWGLAVTIRRPEKDFVIYYKAKESTSEELSIGPVNSELLRGENVTEKEVMMYTVLFLNFFNAKNTILNSINDGKTVSLPIVKQKFGCNIVNARKFTDPWPEFKYTRYYFFNKKLPILGFTGMKTSDRRMTMTLLSYGRNTTNLGSYKMYPAYINFNQQKLIRYDKFTVKTPLNWVLRKNDVPNLGAFGYSSIFGGNIHSSMMQVIYFPATAENYTARIEFVKNHMKQIASRMPMIFESKKRIQSGNWGKSYLYKYKLNFNGQVGYQLSAIIESRKKNAIAYVSVFTNFSEDNSLKKKLPQYTRINERIIKSFRFTQ